MPGFEEEFDDDVAAPAVPVPEVVVGPKAYGLNVGDVVDANDAKRGRYEAMGAGKMRRLPD